HHRSDLFHHAAGAAQEMAPAGPRVRSTDPSMSRLIEEAITRSPMFKRLVATVESFNGVVYIEPGLCPGRIRACLPMWMVSSGSNRFMRIVVDRRQLESDAQVTGVIGHELQHAIEVLSDRFVTDNTKMYFFFRRHAPTAKDRFETVDAINAGIRVEREFRAWRLESAAGDGQNLPNSATARLLSTSVATAN